ncbi:MAG: hypothetical protein BM565_02905 [Gammaproteobacteria bacterium MedPE]|nr:MAG: hypothetical protein BM565_02905 [Gammaproteobacteria bacterium MedPE]
MQMGLFSNNDKSLVLTLQSLMKKATFPNSASPLLSLINLDRARLKKGILELDISAEIPCAHQQGEFVDYFSELFHGAADFTDIDLTIDIDIKRVNHSEKLTQVKQIIMVASGKGGVGKSTTSVNLALALAHGGARVGLLDADIYGPSLPTMVGAVQAKPVSKDGKLLDPVVAHGLNTMSLGFLVDENDATVWRGPMASRALGQLIYETQWPTLDYLVVDMPPGTGDIQLTMSSDVPVSGAVVVTTPQNLALKDAQKGISMFNKVDVPVIGVIENMSYHECDNCGHHSHLFGEEGGRALAQRAKVELVGHLPLSGDIGHDVDNGRPTLISQPDSGAAKAYLAIAVRCAINLNKTNQSIPSLIIGE